jgi:hypothetical protein
MKRGEIVLSAVCLAFFAFMFYEALELRGVGRFGEVGSGFWPLLSLGFATILSLVWLITNLRKYSRERQETGDKPSQDNAAEAWSRVEPRLSVVLHYHTTLDRVHPVDHAVHTGFHLGA